MADKVFEYETGGERYRNSSDIPTITIPAGTKPHFDGTAEREVPAPEAEIPRYIFQQLIAKGKVTQINELDEKVFVATGGGYGSNEMLLDHAIETGLIPEGISTLKGEAVRALPEFLHEIPGVDAQIAKHLAELKGSEPTPEEIEQERRTFYSAEANTRITKAAVNIALEQGISVAHESAGIYYDTAQRAAIANDAGMRTVLIAGDRDHDEAIKEKAAAGKVNKEGTALSYKLFSENMQNGAFDSATNITEPSLESSFDEIYLFNTNQSPPTLMASKMRGEDWKIVEGQETAFAEFKNKRLMSTEKYKSQVSAASTIVDEHHVRAGEQQAAEKGGRSQ